MQETLTQNLRPLFLEALSKLLWTKVAKCYERTAQAQRFQDDTDDYLDCQRTCFMLFAFMRAHPTRRETEEYLLLIVRLLDCSYPPPAIARGAPFCEFLGSITGARALDAFFGLLESRNAQVS